MMSRDKSSYSMLQMKMNDAQKSKPQVRSNVTQGAKGTKASPGKDSKSDDILVVMQVNARGNDVNRFSSIKPDPKQEEETDPDLPDRSYGDFYCKICDSHMNSDNMWEAHVTGKKHQKNVKKGESDIKYEFLDVESDVKYALENIKDPVVGLDYIHEIRRREPGVPSMFNCFLCHASIATCPLVVEHILDYKHRSHYIKDVEPDEYELIAKMNLKKASAEPLVAETAAKLEKKYGRGSVKVKQVKGKPAAPSSYKRGYDSDDEYDDYRNPSKGQKKATKQPNVWKAFDVQDKKISYERERNANSKDYSPIDEFRMRSHHSRRSPSYSPPFSSPYRKSEYTRDRKYEPYGFQGDLDSRISYRGLSPLSDIYHSRESRLQDSHQMPSYMSSSERRSTYDVPLPHEKNPVQSVLDLQKELAILNSLPADVLLPYVYTRLDSMDSKDSKIVIMMSEVKKKLELIVNTYLTKLRADANQMDSNQGISAGGVPTQLQTPRMNEKKNYFSESVPPFRNASSSPSQQPPATEIRNSIHVNPSKFPELVASMDRQHINDMIYGARNASSASINTSVPQGYPSYQASSYAQGNSNYSSFRDQPSSFRDQPVKQNNSSSIPGLTLTEDIHPYNEYASRNPWPASDASQDNFYRY